MPYDRKAYDKEYREKNKEKIKDYREKNKETIKQSNKEYREKNKEKLKQGNKEFREKNKAYNKEYSEKNKEKIKEYKKDYYEKNKDRLREYEHTDKGIKCRRLSDWRRRGIIFHDYNWIYDVYIARTQCDYCKKDFKNDSDRCLDHDHSITDDNNVRAILCRSCNCKDVLK
tara:strand:- start:18594 stop:19106 length:513 start_codon:yes stop_codon:yes gene_type:complete